ncbi:MAG TPA: pentapeptide repeat-containing protein [Enhygromyxa sp.]|nr:pentapeptide repeat-containing protein [Enhygromyxa sp.]
MSSTITAADIESLCGRPAAFDQFASQLLDTLPEHRRAETLNLRRFGRASVDRASKTVWWAWPWPPDDGLCRPGSHGEALDRRLLRWLGSRDDNPDGELRVVLARAPRDPERWAEQLAGTLRAQTRRPELRVRVHGPTELVRWCEGAEAAIGVDHFRLPRAMAARPHDYSACERALMEVLDRGEDASEHWAVVADELQRRGDPAGESLALALASEVERPSQRRALGRAFVDREAARMIAADRHARLLAFVDARGRSFDVSGFVPVVDDQPEPDRYEVQLWAERVGPFFVRLLARTNYDEWRGLGLPEPVLAAPELRYLSSTRMCSIHPECADLSGRDLSGFSLSGLPAVGRQVYAYEASLRGCDLRQADLSQWQLDGADLREARADLHTRFSHASFAEARVSAELERLLQSWNAGRYRRRGDRSRGTASVRDLLIH